MSPRAALAGGIVLAFTVAGCVSRDQRLYDEAERLWMNDRHESAVSKFMLLADEYPDSKLAPMALFRVGEIFYLNLDDPEKAIESFERVAENNKDGDIGLRAREYLIEIYENSSVRNFDQAIVQYQLVLNEHESRVARDEYLYRIATAYFRKEDYNQAIVEFSSLLEKYPQSSFRLDAWYQIASCKFVLGNAADALPIFQKLLKENLSPSREYDVRLGIGMCYEEMEKLADALRIYEKMIELHPGRELIERKISSVKKRMEKKLRD